MLLWSACTQTPSTYPNIHQEESAELKLSSSDSALVEIFNWAVLASKGHVGSDNDPVGPWYEAALPDRAAFCMRDMSHQCIGEEINGHGKQNLNMMTRFMENISESKDFCSYWEINKDNLPAPVDYESDIDFWYNLPANFDVIDACFRLYLWTGNETYISHPDFVRFRELTLNRYIERWQLQPDKIMKRPTVMNEPNPLPATMRFRHARGIPSYDESISGLHVTCDLIAVMYKACIVSSDIMKYYAGNHRLSDEYRKKAETYYQLYESWWNPVTQRYYYASVGDRFLEEGGSEIYVPWYGAETPSNTVKSTGNLVRDPARLTQMLNRLSEKNYNIEVRSYYPMIYYRYGMNDIAYRYLKNLYADERRDYPEIASATIEGIVSGMIGIEPDALRNTIRTCPRLTDATQWVSVENVPVFSGWISVSHASPQKTSFVNKTKKDITWRACFQGNYRTIIYNGKSIKTDKFKDGIGNTYSFIEIPCKPGMMITAEAVVR